MTDDELSKDFRFVTANSFARIDGKFKSALFCLYGIEAKNKDGLGKACNSLGKGGSAYPVVLHLIELSDFKVPELKVSRGPEHAVYAVELGERALKNGSYLSISAPIIHAPSGETSWKEAREAIARTIGLIVSMVGRGPIFGMAIELEVPAGQEFRQSVFTAGVRMPQPMEFLMLGDMRAVQEIARKLLSASGDLRNRLEYGASLVGRASQEDDETFRFLLHWMALEVVADGKEREVTDHLAKAYGVEFAAVRDALELRACLRMRNDIVHLGQTRMLSAHMERLLQGYFLDLMRFELSLPCLRITESFIAAAASAPDVSYVEPDAAD